MIMSIKLCVIDYSKYTNIQLRVYHVGLIKFDNSISSALRFEIINLILNRHRVKIIDIFLIKYTLYDVINMHFQLTS